MAKLNLEVPALKLSDGHSIPMLAYGTGTAWYKSEEGKEDRTLVDSIKKAIETGYYHLDGAEMYNTEPELGAAIEESKVERNKLFVTTKVHKNMKDIPDALRTSLKKLKLDYVDLYLIHSPFHFNSDEEIQKAWADMEELQAAGLTRSIGVSNFLPKHLDAIMKTAKKPPVMNQIEFNPYLQHKQLLEYHKKHNIATAAYAPLTPITKATPGPLDSTLEAYAKKYAVGPSEILLRWAIDQDVVPVTTTSKEQRMSDFLRAATFKLTPVEIQKLNELGNEKHYRGFWQKFFDDNDRS